MQNVNLLLLFILCHTSIFGQDRHHVEHTFHSEVFGKDRTISVSLPERYFLRDSNTLFATTYVLDGQYTPFWNMARANISYLTDSYNVIPMIAVGIHSDNRNAEFTPPAKLLTAHIKDEVMPLIDSVYRTNSFRSLVGHSWAGQFIATTLFSDQTGLFDAYIAVSPSLGYKNNLAIHKANEFLSKDRDLSKYLYCSTGDLGIRELNFSAQVALLDSILLAKNNSGLVWQTSTFEGRGHWSCVIPSISEGLINMSRNYWADQMVITQLADLQDGQLRSHIEQFNAQVEANFGFYGALDAHYLKFVAQDFEEQERNQAAEELFLWSLELNPNIMSTHKGLAYVLKKQQKFAAAIHAYENGFALLKRQKEEFAPSEFKDKSDWFTKKIAELENRN